MVAVYYVALRLRLLPKAFWRMESCIAYEDIMKASGGLRGVQCRRWGRQGGRLWAQVEVYGV